MQLQEQKTQNTGILKELTERAQAPHNSLSEQEPVPLQWKEPD